MWTVPRAVIELNPDALDIAHERDSERERDSVRGPLHGIPFLVKDVSVGPVDSLVVTWAILMRHGRISPPKTKCKQPQGLRVSYLNSGVPPKR